MIYYFLWTYQANKKEAKGIKQAKMFQLCDVCRIQVYKILQIFYKMENSLNFQGYRFLLRKCKQGEITISAYDQLTNQTFFVDSVKLVKVSSSTIEVALKKQLSDIKCQLKRKEKQLLFTIVVEFQYLPKIEETLVLELLEGVEQKKIVFFNELKAEIQKLQQSFNFQVKGNKTKMGSLDSSLGKQGVFECELTEGVYLVEISGAITTNYNDYDYDDQMYYDGGANFSKRLSATLIIQMLNKNEEFSFSQAINKGEGYETCFSFTKSLDLKKQAHIKILLNIAQLNATITNSFVFIWPASKM